MDNTDDSVAMTVRLSPDARKLLKRLKRQQGGSYKTVIEAAIRLMAMANGMYKNGEVIEGGASDTAASTAASARKK